MRPRVQEAPKPANVKAQSVIPQDGLERIARNVKLALAVPGDLAEFGVWKGGSAQVIARGAAGTGRTLHLFDTFAGMPDIVNRNAGDLHNAGDFGETSLDLVRSALVGIETPIEFHVGVFPKVDLPAGPFCFVHIDSDLYESYRSGLAYFWPRLSRGGVLVMDDIFHVGCPGALRAANEFFLPIGIKPDTVITKGARRASNGGK